MLEIHSAVDLIFHSALTHLNPLKVRGEQHEEYKKRNKSLQYLSESELAAFKNTLSFRDSCLGYF